VLGEGSASGPLEDAIKNFGYEPLIEEYGLKLVDFNKDKSIELEGLDSKLAPLRFKESKALHD
jgi:uncharacterized protein (DUF362 family)